MHRLYVQQCVFFVVYMFLTCINVTAMAETYVIPQEFIKIDQEVKINLEVGSNIYSEVVPHCDIFTDLHTCHLAMDTLSLKVYKHAFYTPSRPSSQLEDFTSTRRDVITYLLKRYEYSSYLEIGCASDFVFKSLSDVVHGNAVGVDPQQGGTHRMTSDQFFSENTRMFDLIFIDGDHRATQVVIDVFNALRWLSPGGTIVMHDTNAQFKMQTAFPQDPESLVYNGDVWKVIPLIRMQDGLEVVTIDIEHGVTVIRRKPNMHRLPSELERRVLLSSGLETFTFEEFDMSYRNTLLRLVTMKEFRDWLNE